MNAPLRRPGSGSGPTAADRNGRSRSAADANPPPLKRAPSFHDEKQESPDDSPVPFPCLAHTSGGERRMPPRSGDSVGIRTRDPQLRRLLLYPTELRNRSDTAKLAQLFRICNTGLPGFDHGPRDKRPTTGPAPIPPVKLRSATYEKAPQRPSSASSDRPSSQRRVVRITRRKATRRSDEKRSFGPNSAKRKKNRSYRIAPDRAHTDSAKRTNGIPTRRPDGTGPIRDTPCKIRSCYRIRPFR